MADNPIVQNQLAILLERLNNLETKLVKLEKENSELKSKNQKLEAQVAWFVRKFYGKQSEKISELDPNQFEIPFEEWSSKDNDDAINALRKEADLEIEQQAKEADKPKAKRKVRDITKDGNLPVLKKVIEPDENIDLSRYKVIGHKTTRKLEIIPGMAFILELDRPVYGLKSGNIDAPEDQDGIIVANLPPMIIDKGLYGNLLVTEIMLDKFLYYMPFYRQHQKYQSLGIDIKKNTIEDCLDPVADLMKPLAYELNDVIIHHNDYAQCDGTVCPVVNHIRHQADNEYIWTLRAPQLNLISYNYRHEGSRGHIVADELFRDFKGYLQTDDYSIYDTLCKQSNMQIQHVGCMAHCRRYVEKALNENKKLASQGLYLFQQLYKVEKIADDKGMNYEERRELRKKLSAPELDALEKWCKDTASSTHVQYRPKGLLGSAVRHILKNIDSLRVYLNDGRIAIDNNGCEQAQKNIVIGRKNWIFAGNHAAATKMCYIISLLASCKACGVNPRDWFYDVATKMAERRDYHKQYDLRELLPDRWKVHHDEETSKNAELCRTFFQEFK